MWEYAPDLICFGASFFAASIISLDNACKYREPFVVIRTKEWLGLFAVNIIVAYVIIFSLYSVNRLDFTFTGLAGIIIGYPLLMNSKIWSIKNSSGELTPVGPEFITQLANSLLKDGISNSIDDKCGELLKEWQIIDIRRLAPNAKTYFISHKGDPGLPGWVDELLKDAEENPPHSLDNSNTLFIKIEELGGQRGLKWVIKHSK